MQGFSTKLPVQRQRLPSVGRLRLDSASALVRFSQEWRRLPPSLTMLRGQRPNPMRTEIVAPDSFRDSDGQPAARLAAQLGQAAKCQADLRLGLHSWSRLWSAS